MFAFAEHASQFILYVPAERAPPLHLQSMMNICVCKACFAFAFAWSASICKLMADKDRRQYIRP